MTEFPYVRQSVHFSDPVQYAYGGPDSFQQDGVPRGSITEHEWSASEIYPDTTRRYWVYVPAQYMATEPASLMVFQDGDWYLNPAREARAGVVFDNLIYRGEMPVTVGVFVDPGVRTSGTADQNHRNLEYDTFSDAYATFLLAEILPRVQASHAISEDPDRWAICGGSSGGSCAFTAAWLRPDRFRRVISFLGSFAQLRGGNIYPELILETPRKPLRVFLQAATRDLNWNASAFNWFSANLRVAASLAERDYDFRFVLGDGEHDANHAGVILPDALRWLWRDWSVGS